MRPTVTLYTDDGDVLLPARYEVCDDCDGHGRYPNRAFDGFSMNEVYEDYGPDADDFIDDYLAGHYDVRCDTCRGERVVAVLDETMCSPENIEAYRQQEREVAESYAMQRAEMMMGA